MEEVEQICTRIAIMDKGKVIALEFLYSGGKHNLLKFLGKSVLLMSRFLPA
jgi:hypothetical protein